jgi:hypothetical protein
VSPSSSDSVVIRDQNNVICNTRKMAREAPCGKWGENTKVTCTISPQGPKTITGGIVCTRS